MEGKERTFAQKMNDNDAHSEQIEESDNDLKSVFRTVTEKPVIT